MGTSMLILAIAALAGNGFSPELFGPLDCSFSLCVVLIHLLLDADIETPKKLSVHGSKQDVCFLPV